MTHLVDTDWVIEFLKGREPAISTLPRLTHDGMAISIITFGEVYEGVYYGRSPRDNERGFRAFLRRARVLPLHRGTMRRFARVRGQLRTAGQLIGDTDLLIAATALHHDLILVTHNRREFARVPGLRIYQA